MQLKPVGRRGLRNPTLNELEDSLPSPTSSDSSKPVLFLVYPLSGFYFFYS